MDIADARLAPASTDLIRGADWALRGRFMYGVFFVVPAVVVLVASSLRGHNSVGTQVVLLAVFWLPVAIAEWRVRRMGFRVTEDGIELVRALNRTFVPWESIAAFTAAERGMWGNAYVFIKRRGGFRRSLPLPTVALMRVSWPLPGRPGLCWHGGGAHDTMAFLSSQLDARQPLPR